MTQFGVRSTVAPLRRVAVRPPAASSDFAAAHWAQPLDRELLVEEHAGFVRLLHSLECEVVELPAIEALADSCFTYDPVFVTGRGVIVFQAAKEVRAEEPETLANELAGLGLPIIGRLTGDACADGGDCFWLDDHTLAVGRGYRTNAEGISQMRALLEPEGVSVEEFQLPHDQGPEYCLHLMSVVSMVRDDLAVVYERLAPVALLDALRVRGIDWVVVPDAEYASLGCNVLAVRPGVVVIAEGNDETAMLLRQRGVHVHIYSASQINKGEGGPTCLTRPLWRA